MADKVITPKQKRLSKSERKHARRLKQEARKNLSNQRQSASAG